MDFSPEEERAGIHTTINLHAKRIVTAFYSIIECSQLEANRDCLIRTDIDNFQLKLHNDCLLHSCRSLYTVASDIAINALIHTPERNPQARLERETAVARDLDGLRSRIAEFEDSLDRE